MMEFKIVPKPESFSSGTSKYDDVLKAYALLKPGQSIILDIPSDMASVGDSLRTTIRNKKLVRSSFRRVGDKIYIFQNPKATGGAPLAQKLGASPAA